MLPRSYIELLSPARDLQCAKAAISHGADAIYIGAPEFSARKSAGNNLDDIAEAVKFAHLYKARVFVALNTLLTDAELPRAVDMAWQLHNIGADALIIQDLGLLTQQMPPIELHASTQTDNRTPEKALFWQNVGFEQVVLARELSLKEIRKIKEATNVRLECFVHGALCVCYSGQCYMSQCVNGRSANRGDCAQPCRLPYDLFDANGVQIARQKHLLSMRDFNLSNRLEELIDAGASTLKIEGRLKDAAYVANVTLYYRRKLDEILNRRPYLHRFSIGDVASTFTPNLDRTFNRRFTTYFIDGRKAPVCQPDTPKAIGQPVGHLKETRTNSFRLDGNIPIHNGDGLCFRNANGLFEGLHVNTVDNGWITPRKMPKIPAGAELFRNADVEFDAILAADKTQRLIDVDITLDASNNELTLTIGSATHSILIEAQPANNPIANADKQRQQLSKLGGTPFRARNITISPAAAALFIPLSTLNELRRTTAAELQNALENAPADKSTHTAIPNAQYPFPLDARTNIINNAAKSFYEQHGASFAQWGYERQTPAPNCNVMTTRHCILWSLGHCLKQKPDFRNRTPLFLVGDNGRYRIDFNCAQCEMQISRTSSA